MPRMMMSKRTTLSDEALPPPPAMATFGSPAAESSSSVINDYSVETDVIQMDQAYRMVSKVINSKKS